jgi:hypothetical protein
MRITIESTSRIVEIETPTGKIPARLWEGRTDSGVPVECLVTRIAAHKSADLAQFEAELQEQPPPRFRESAFGTGRAIDLRFIL